MTDRKELKARAREALLKTRPSAIWVTLTVAAVLIVLHALSLTLSGDLEAYRAMLESALAGQFTYVMPVGTTSVVGWLLTVALDLMGFVVPVGYMLYILRLSRREGPSFGDVFDVFGFFPRAVWFSILRSVAISVWGFVYALPASLLGTVIDPLVAATVCLPLLAPMFMAAYSYRLAGFIMLDERQYGCLQCLALSRLAMRGRKWELFLLDLSFLGWMLLGIVPFMLLWEAPYRRTACALWYEEIMPGFREKLEKDLAERAEAFRAGPRYRYHVPGERRDGADEDSDDGEKEDESAEDAKEEYDHEEDENREQ